MATQHNFKKITTRYKRLKSNLMKIIGNEAVKFSKDNFRKSGFQESAGRIAKWKKRKPGSDRDKGRAILVDSGKLKRSVRVTRTTKTQVHIGSNVTYAKVHNEGERVRGKGKVRTHKRKTASGRITIVKAHTRKVNFKMPQRKFIGPSQTLNDRVNKRFSKELINVFKA